MKANEQFSQQDILKKARDYLKEAEKEKPARLEDDLRKAQLKLTELRDRMIKDMRRGEEALPGTGPRLEKVNMILSLITGVEYPTGGIEREKIKQAGKALSELYTVKLSPRNNVVTDLNMS